MASRERGDSPGDRELEAELVAAAQRNEPAAIAALLARHEGSIYRFALRLCRDPEDARDVLQETMLAAARGFPSYRGQAAVDTWLYTIARSFCIKQRRRVRVDSVSSDVEDGAREIPDPRASPVVVAMGHELGGAVQRAMDELADPYREVLVLRDVEGLTAPEVAQVLGIGVDAVKSRLHRARVAVREKLAPWVGAVEAPVQGCPDVLALFSRRLEGEIDAHLCEEMEHHLAGCPRCSAACDGLKRTLSLCAATRQAKVPPKVQVSVRRAVEELLHVKA
jgi:RNA polymerase sigma-70 factor (ECF subfamily)